MAELPKLPLSFAAQVTFEKPLAEQESFHFTFKLKNTSDKTVVLNMWYSGPHVLEIGPSSLVHKKNIVKLRGRQAPPAPRDVLRLQPGEEKIIKEDHRGYETFPYFTTIINQKGPADDITAYLMNGKGSYSVKFCWKFYSLNRQSLAKDHLKPGEDFWAGEVCAPPTNFEIKFDLLKDPK